jgi:hypothetical protein
MATTWTIGIDWNRDGDYGDSYEDLTARVQSATWFLGMRQPYQDAAIIDEDVLIDLVGQFLGEALGEHPAFTGVGDEEFVGHVGA